LSRAARVCAENEVDALEVFVLVDNVNNSPSPNPTDVLPEWSALLTGGKLRSLAGSNICCAHHATMDGRRRTPLFRTPGAFS
jgi:hypothetical protein